MAKVLCTLPNASEEISGVKFEKTEHGMLSEDIPDAVAAAFLEIPGYKVDGDVDGDGDSDLADLVARAIELGIAVNAKWKAQRLTAEIKRAEDAAADAAETAAAKATAEAAAAEKAAAEKVAADEKAAADAAADAATKATEGKKK